MSIKTDTENTGYGFSPEPEHVYIIVGDPVPELANSIVIEAPTEYKDSDSLKQEAGQIYKKMIDAYYALKKPKKGIFVLNCIPPLAHYLAEIAAIGTYATMGYYKGKLYPLHPITLASHMDYWAVDGVPIPYSELVKYYKGGESK